MSGHVDRRVLAPSAGLFVGYALLRLLTSTSVVALGLVLATTTPSRAADISWLGGTSTDWFDPANWSAGVPTSADIARIDLVSPNPTVVDGAAVGGPNAVTSVFLVGDTGTGMLTIQNGGTLSSASGAQTSTVGSKAGSTGTMIIDGLGSSYTNTGTALVVGGAGTGTLTIKNGATANTSGGRIGDNAGGNGTVTVDGTGSSWTGPSNFYVGAAGHGTLTVRNGGLVDVGNAYIGSSSTGTGDVAVDGQNSNLNVTNLNVASNGVGTLTVRNGGSVNVTGALRVARYSRGTGTLNIGAAAGQAAAAPGTVNASGLQFGAGNGRLVFNHTGSNYSFAPTISGAGSVNVEAGTTILTANNTYSGPTNVNGGTLLVNGSITSDVSVSSGGTLGGTGAVGALDVFNKGVYAPGNSIGTQRVNGNFTLHKGAIYEVEVNAAGKGDKAIVKGTVNLTGSTLRVLAANGNYKPKTHYTIIDNDGSDAVKGTFKKVSENLAFLFSSTDLAGTLQLALVRLGIGFGLHALWTGIAGASLAYVLGRRSAGLAPRWGVAVLGLLLPMLLHALWDAPSPSISPPVVYSILGTVYLLTLAAFVGWAVAGRAQSTSASRLPSR